MSEDTDGTFEGSEIFYYMEDEEIARIKQGREWWRWLGKHSMCSAIGEYVPAEFFALLDYIDELESKLEVLNDK